MYEAEVTYRGKSHYAAKMDDYVVDVNLAGVRGASTTPLPLFLASLGSCVAVYLERYLDGGKVSFSSFSIRVRSELSKERPVALKQIEVAVTIDGVTLDEQRKKALLSFVKNCPVHNTLVARPEIVITIA